MLAGVVGSPRCAKLGLPPSAVMAITDTAQRKHLMTIPNQGLAASGFPRPATSPPIVRRLKAEAITFPKKCELEVEKSTQVRPFRSRRLVTKMGRLY
jgi:hypothetical protein